MPDTDTQQSAGPEAAPESPSAPSKRERPKPSPEKAEAAALKKQGKRAFEKLLESDDPEELRRMVAALKGEGAPAAAVVDGGAALAPVTEKAPAQAGPTPEELAQFTELGAALVQIVAGPLKGTKFDPMELRPDPLGGAPVVPAKRLAEALGPVLAKHLPNALATPEGNLALAAALWLGPPALELLTAKLGEGVAAGSAGQKAA